MFVSLKAQVVIITIIINFSIGASNPDECNHNANSLDQDLVHNYLGLIEYKNTSILAICEM